MPTDETPDVVPLGAPEVVYRSHANLSRDKALASLCGVLMCVFAKLFGTEPDDMALVIAGTIALCILGVSGLVRGWVCKTRLSVFRNGVLVESLWSNTFTRWEDVEAVFEFDPPPGRNWLGDEVANYQCGFSRVDGKTFWFHINRLSNLRDCASQLHKRADTLIRARTLRVLTAGEVVWFGYLGIGRDGIHSRKGVLPWTEVSFAGCVHGTHFEVLKKGSSWGWFSRKISEVENVAILTELMRTWKEWAPAS